ncbi:MAG: sterol-binding protein [Paucimonas sp.]|nr:sterol-binding protein [Paucimonas sp.]
MPGGFFISDILMTPSLIAAGIDHLLEQDALAKRRLAAHAGKTARIDTGILDLRLAVQAGGAVAVAEAGSAAAVSVFLKAADLPLILQDRTRAMSHVRIEGDAEFANTLSQLFNSLRWDAEEDLARVFGDLAAVRIASTARKGLHAARSAHASLMENVTEYLLEENPTLVRQEALRDFSGAVNDLRDDVERLAKRIERLKGRA